MPDSLKPHPALAARKEAAACGVVEISGYVAPSPDDGIIELWKELDGEIRMDIPRSIILGSRQDDASSRVVLTVPADAEIRVTQIACDRIEAAMLEGLNEEILEPEAINVAVAHLNAQKGKTTQDPKKCKKFCRTIPWWRCAASVIVVVTVNVCTSTWPCSTASQSGPDSITPPKG